MLLWPLDLLPPQAHPGCGTAVDVDHLSSNEVGGVGGEESCGRGDVLRVTYPARGDQGVTELGGIVGGIEVAGDFDQAWSDGVDTHPAICELDGQLAGEGVDSTLRGRVGGVAREPGVAVNGGDVND